MKKSILIGASLAGLLAIPVLAQTSPPTPPGPMAHAGHMQRGDWNEAQTRADVEKKIAERFGEADANKDGAVTKAEFDARIAAVKAEAQARMKEARGKVFDSLDTDKNGQVSRAEWDAHHAAMAMGKDGRHGGKHAMGDGERGGPGGKGMRMMAHRGGWGDTWFADADANKDGRVTLAEAKAKPLEHFARMDADKNGTVTPEERKAAHEALRAEWKAKRGS